MVIPSIDEFVKVGGGVLLAVKSKVQIVVALRMTQPGKRKRGRSKNVEKDGTAGIRIDMGGGGRYKLWRRTRPGGGGTCPTGGLRD